MISYNFRIFLVILIILCMHYEESLAKNLTKKGSKKNNTKLSPIQIRAILGSCKNKTNPAQTSASEITDCSRRMIIRIKMNYFGEACLDNQFVVVHHAYDAVTDKKLRLLHPLVVRLKQELIYQIYQLHPMKVMINSEATEEVINNESANFTGCNTASTTPTCGFTYLNKAVVPFSEGFCCSCDESVNDLRQPCEGNSGSRCDEERRCSFSLINEPLDRVSRDIKLKSFKRHKTSNKEKKRKHSSSNKHMGYIKNEKSVPGSKYTRRIHGYINKLNSEYHGNSSTSVPDNKQFMKIHDIHSVPYFKLLPDQPKLHKYKPKEMSYVGKLDSSHNYESDSIDQKIKKLQSMENNSEKLIGNNVYGAYDIQDSTKLEKIKFSNGSNKLSYFSIMKPVLFNESVLVTEHENLLNASHLKNMFQVGSAMNALKHQDFNDLTSDSFNYKPHPSKKEIFKLPNGVTKFRKLPQKSVLKSNFGGAKFNSEKGTYENLIEQINTNEYLEKDSCKSGDCDFPEDKQGNHANRFVNYQKYSSGRNFPEKKESISFEQGHSMKISDYLKRKDIQLLNDPKASKYNPSEDKTVINGDESNKIITKRDASTNDKQTRGGQSCTSCKEPPPCADPETYYESAHCLRYSDLWFSVYKLKHPIIDDNVGIRLYSKRDSKDQKACWTNLSKRLNGIIGSLNRFIFDDSKTITASYTAPDKAFFSIDVFDAYLLIPQSIPDCKIVLHPEAACGPEEYLILREDDITFDGDECDKAGVGFEAFARQANRCGKKRGSCLSNQPVHLWRRDKNAKKKGKKGIYFLENYVPVGEQPIQYNSTSGVRVLRVVYPHWYTSNIELHVNADNIAVVNVGIGRITEVFTDAVIEKQTEIKVTVTNTGAASTAYFTKLADCSAKLPAPISPDGDSDSDSILVPPQYPHTYTIILPGSLPKKNVHCTVKVLSPNGEAIASRTFHMRKGYRSMCLWHCQCVCVNYPEHAITCKPMLLEHYNFAGFIGHLPVSASFPCTVIHTTVVFILRGVFGVIMFLLLLGITKALLGLCVSLIAAWGLWLIKPEEAKSLICYIEPHLSCCKTIYDCEEFPVHPETYQRYVRFLPRCEEFLVNCLFFILVIPNLCLWRLEKGKWGHSCQHCYNVPPPSKYCIFSNPVMQKRQYSPLYSHNEQDHKHMFTHRRATRNPRVLSSSSTIHRKYHPCVSDLENNFPVLDGSSPKHYSSSYHKSHFPHNDTHFNRHVDESPSSTSEYGYKHGRLYERHNWHY